MDLTFLGLYQPRYPIVIRFLKGFQNFLAIRHACWYHIQTARSLEVGPATPPVSDYLVAIGCCLPMM